MVLHTSYNSLLVHEIPNFSLSQLTILSVGFIKTDVSIVLSAISSKRPVMFTLRRATEAENFNHVLACGKVPNVLGLIVTLDARF